MKCVQHFNLWGVLLAVNSGSRQLNSGIEEPGFHDKIYCILPSFYEMYYVCDSGFLLMHWGPSWDMAFEVSVHSNFVLNCIAFELALFYCIEEIAN